VAAIEAGGRGNPKRAWQPIKAHGYGVSYKESVSLGNRADYLIRLYFIKYFAALVVGL